MQRYKELERRIESLKDSTDLEITGQGIYVNLWRRNSPYVSHRGMEINDGASTKGLVVSNRNTYIVVLPNLTYLRPRIRGGEFHLLKVPIRGINRVFNDIPLITPDFGNADSELVWVAFEDEFVDYDEEDGRPVFARRHEEMDVEWVGSFYSDKAEEEEVYFLPELP